MAPSSLSLSSHSGFSLSPSSSSSSFSYLYSRNARPRPLPHRGQIKAAIFASFFASIARLLGANTPDERGNGVNSQDGAGSSVCRSDFRVEVEGGQFDLSAVRSSPASNLAGSAMPDSSFSTLSCSHSYCEGMCGRDG